MQQLPDNAASENPCVALCTCQQSGSLEKVILCCSTRATGGLTSLTVTRPIKRRDLSWARSDPPLHWEPQVTVSVPQPWPLNADWLTQRSSRWPHPANRAIAKENVNIDLLGPIVRCLEPLTPRVAIKQSWFATWEPNSVCLTLTFCFLLLLLLLRLLWVPVAQSGPSRAKQLLNRQRAREQIPVLPLLSTLNRPHTEVGKSIGGVCQVEIMFLLTSCCVSQGYPSLPRRRTLEPLFSIKSGTVCRYSYLFTALWQR